jgi:hypothetical protein
VPISGNPIPIHTVWCSGLESAYGIFERQLLTPSVTVQSEFADIEFGYSAQYHPRLRRFAADSLLSFRYMQYPLLKETNVA